jgi:hypothetical protein
VPVTVAVEEADNDEEGLLLDEGVLVLDGVLVPVDEDVVVGSAVWEPVAVPDVVAVGLGAAVAPGHPVGRSKAARPTGRPMLPPASTGAMSNATTPAPQVDAAPKSMRTA